MENLAKLRAVGRAFHPAGTWKIRGVAEELIDDNGVGAEIHPSGRMYVFFSNGNRGCFTVQDGVVQLTGAHMGEDN